MGATCPNKNSKQWKNMVEKLGETQALFHYTKNGFQILNEDQINEILNPVITNDNLTTIDEVKDNTPNDIVDEFFSMSSTSEIEAKKADIEKRRQEELKEAKELGILKSGDILYDSVGNELKVKVDKSGRESITDDFFGTYRNRDESYKKNPKEINAKYDAELKALENSSTSTISGTDRTKQENFEYDGDDVTVHQKQLKDQAEDAVAIGDNIYVVSDGMGGGSMKPNTAIFSKLLSKTASTMKLSDYSDKKSYYDELVKRLNSEISKLGFAKKPTLMKGKMFNQAAATLSVVERIDKNKYKIASFGDSTIFIKNTDTGEIKAISEFATDSAMETTPIRVNDDKVNELEERKLESIFTTITLKDNEELIITSDYFTRVDEKHSAEMINSVLNGSHTYDNYDDASLIRVKNINPTSTFKPVSTVAPTTTTTTFLESKLKGINTSNKSKYDLISSKNQPILDSVIDEILMSNEERYEKLFITSTFQDVLTDIYNKQMTNYEVEYLKDREGGYMYGYEKGKDLTPVVTNRIKTTVFNKFYNYFKDLIKILEGVDFKNLSVEKLKQLNFNKIGDVINSKLDSVLESITNSIQSSNILHAYQVDILLNNPKYNSKEQINQTANDLLKQNPTFTNQDIFNALKC